MIFGQVTDDTNKFSASLTILDKNVKDIVKDFKNASFGNKLSAAFGKSGITSEDVAMLRQYNAEIAKGVPEHEAFNKSLSGASNQAKQLAIDAEGAAVSEKALTGATQSYTAAQKVATLATKAFAVALNMAFSLATTYAISKIVEGISAIAHSTEHTIERQKEYNRLREESTRTANANLKEYESEVSELNSLVNQYSNALYVTEDITDAKSTLVQIQGVLNKEYETEGNNLNDLSGKYKTLNEDIREYNRLNAEKSLEANKTEIERARNELSDASWYLRSPENGKVGYGGINFLTEGLSEEEWGDFKSKINQLALKNPIEFDDDAFRIYLSGSFEDAIEDYSQILKLYHEVAPDRLGYNIKEVEQYLSDLINHYKEISEIDVNAAHLESLIYPDDAKSREAIDTFDELTGKAKEYIKIVNSSSSDSATKISAYNEVVKIKDEIDGLIKDYPFLNEEAKKFKDQVAINFGEASGSIEVAKESWLKSLDEAQKGVLSNVDKITSAMTKLTSGEAIDSKAAWDIINLDDNKLLSSISIDANGDYIFDLEQIVKLKDEILQKEIETREESIKTAKQNAKTAEENIKVAESQIYALRPKMAAAYDSGDKELIAELEAEYERLKRIVESNRSSLEAYNYTIRNESLYVSELKQRLGDLTNTVDMLKAKVEQLKKAVSNLEKEAEARLKAQEHVIDGIIDKFQKEADELEKQKEVLDEQLETLEKQKDELNEIIGNYKTVSDFVSNTIEKQIDEIEDSKSKIEEYYDSLIEKLKEENEERQDAIDKEEKLAALANAQNNKVRYYDAERGWTYGVDQNALKKAQNDLDKTLKDEQIKDLEKQKKEEIAPLEEEIKALKEWSEEWGNATDFITEAENELLAEEILGSDWREKIKSKDIATLDAFKARYKNYNDSLKNIVNTEMKSLKDSIKAKEDEIAVKKKQIQAWRDYKSEVQSAANDIKNGLEGYVAYLGTVKLTEASTNEERLNNLSTFTTAYKGLIQTITSYNTEIDATEGKINNLSTSFAKVAGTVKDMSSTVSDYVGRLGEVDDVMGSIFPETQNSSGGFLGGISGIGNSMSTLNKPIEDLIKEIIKIFQKSIFDKIPHYAEGGVNTTTGFAWMDGTKANPELILNSADISRLY